MSRRPKTDVLQGTLSLLVLRALQARGPLHGYALTTHIHAVSDNLLRLEEGSLYPALHRMEQDGWIRARWGTTDKGRRARIYTLTPTGERQLAIERDNWVRLTEGVARVLGPA
ncbi:MAG TPA: PadR family transcriptional regulator [Vicinamibacterales bacterium]|nr:PadR family transcriptional regulator [Vicinamibacterales bacterium]